MTVQTNTSTASFAGNGTTTAFPIGFKFNSAADLALMLIDDSTGSALPLVLNSHYVVTGAGDDAGGLVTLITAPADGQTLKVRREVDVLQQTDLRNQGKFFAEVHEDAFDLLTMIAQQHAEGINSAIRVAESDSPPSRLPPAVIRANQVMAFDSNGDPVAVIPVSGSVGEFAINLLNSVDPAKGASLVGYKGRTLHARLGLDAFPRDFGAAGDGVTNDTTPVQSAIATGAPVRIHDSHVVASPISVPAELELKADPGGQIIATSASSVLNLDGAHGSVIDGVKSTGNAAPDSAQSKMFVNTQTTGSANNCEYRNLDLSGFTLGLNLTKGTGNKVLGGRYGGMVYSPVTLGSAGGYGVLLQGEKNTEIAGVTFTASATDRHAVYVSKLVTDPVAVGHCEDVNIRDVAVDWLATNGTGDESKLIFAARSPAGLFVKNVASKGGSGFVRVLTENGPASNIAILGNSAFQVESRNSQFCAPLAIGQAGTGYSVSRVTISGNRTRISRGAGQPAARDCGGLFSNVNNMHITDHISTVDSGVMFSFDSCTDVLLDNITDIVSGLNGPNTQPVLAFTGTCARFTIGKIAHQRADISSKRALFGGLDNVTDMTCLFGRTFKVITNGAGGYTLSDPWDLVSSVTLNTGNLVVQFKAHVTQAAADDAQYRLTSATHANAYRSGSASKTGTVVVMTFAGAAANPQSSVFTVEGILSK